MIPDDLILEGERVKLLPMESRHAEELAACSKADEIWDYLPKKATSLEVMAEIIEQALKGKKLGQEFPFVVFDKALGKLVGSTRYLAINATHRNLEIGWTWYSPEVWRTRVNTECKYLLLKYGFEELRLLRVQLKTDTRNERSNNAIRRIGGIHEGVLRQDRIMHDGYIRNANLYSIIDSEWPEVKSKLEGFLHR
mgnify:CR=1 FL=1